MDMNTRSELPRTELVHIGDIGFLFEVNYAFKHNLISPDVLAFFDGMPESEEVTKDCAFPLPIPNTNILHSIFQYIGYGWTVCSDGIFRKCQKVKCLAEHNLITNTMIFHIDKTLVSGDIAGIIQL